MNDARERMIDSAQRLLARRGYGAATFSAVLSDSHAPRGSIYHHFPDGKDQLVAAAIERTSAQMSEVILAATGKSAIEVTRQFLDAWKTLLDAFDCDGGCAVLAVAVAGPPEQRDLAASIFDTSLSLLEAALSTGGLRKPDAKAFAYLLISAVEGAVVLSRSKHSLAPFEIVATQMRREVRRLAGQAR